MTIDLVGVALGLGTHVWIIDVTTPAWTARMNCTLGAPDGKCDQTTPHFFLGPDSAPSLFLEDAQPSFEVTVSIDGIVRGHQTFTPSYAQSHPNGPSCDPTCLGARATMTLR